MSRWNNDWNAIRTFYELWNPIILAERADEWAIDTYEWDNGMIQMTPIEFGLWQDIRLHSAILYPQYPVGRVFVDFANPVAKVAIECDGKEYHRDWRKDEARDDTLRAAGWKVYRIEGWECLTDFDEESRERGRGDLLIEAICQRHRIARNCTQAGDGGMVCCASYFSEEVIAEMVRDFEIRGKFLSKHPQYSVLGAGAGQ